MKKIFMFLMATALLALPSCGEDDVTTSGSSATVTYTPILTDVGDGSSTGAVGEFGDDYSKFSFYSNADEVTAEIKFAIDEGYKILSASPSKENGEVVARTGSLTRAADGSPMFYVTNIQDDRVTLVKCANADGDQLISVTFATDAGKPAGTFKFTATTSLSAVTPSVTSITSPDTDYVVECSAIDATALSSTALLRYGRVDYTANFELVTPAGVSIVTGAENLSIKALDGTATSNFTVDYSGTKGFAVGVVGGVESASAVVAYKVQNNVSEQVEYLFTVSVGAKPGIPEVALADATYASLSEATEVGNNREYTMNFKSIATTSNSVALAVKSTNEGDKNLELTVNGTTANYFDVVLKGYDITVTLKDDPTASSNYSGSFTIVEYVDGVANPFPVVVNLTSDPTADLLSGVSKSGDSVGTLSSYSFVYDSSYDAMSQKFSATAKSAPITITSVESSSAAYTVVKDSDTEFTVTAVATTTSKESGKIRMTVTDGTDIARYDLAVSEAVAISANISSLTLNDEASTFGTISEENHRFDYLYTATKSDVITLTVTTASNNKLSVTGNSALILSEIADANAPVFTFTVTLPDSKLSAEEVLSIVAVDADGGSYTWPLTIAQNVPAPTPDITSITGAGAFGTGSVADGSYTYVFNNTEASQLETITLGLTEYATVVEVTGTTNYVVTTVNTISSQFYLEMAATVKGSDDAEGVVVKLINRDGEEKEITIMVSEAAIDAPAITSLVETTADEYISAGTVTSEDGAYSFEFNNTTSDVAAIFDLTLPLGTYVDAATCSNNGSTKYTIEAVSGSTSQVQITMLAANKGTDAAESLTIGLKNYDGVTATASIVVSEVLAPNAVVTAISELTDPVVGSLTALDAANENASYFVFNATATENVVATFEVEMDDALTISTFASSTNFTFAQVVDQPKQFTITMVTPTETAEDLSFTVTNNDEVSTTYKIQASMMEPIDPEILTFADVTDPTVGTLTAFDADKKAAYVFNSSASDVTAKFQFTLAEGSTLTCNENTLYTAVVDGDILSVTLAATTLSSASSSDLELVVKNDVGDIATYTIALSEAAAPVVTVGALTMTNDGGVASDFTGEISAYSVKFGELATSSKGATFQLSIDSGYITVDAATGVTASVVDMFAGTFSVVVSDTSAASAEPVAVTVKTYDSDGVVTGEDIILSVSWEAYSSDDVISAILLSSGGSWGTLSGSVADGYTCAMTSQAATDLANGTSVSIKFQFENIKEGYELALPAGVSYTELITGLTFKSVKTVGGVDFNFAYSEGFVTEGTFDINIGKPAGGETDGSATEYTDIETIKLTVIPPVVE